MKQLALFISIYLFVATFSFGQQLDKSLLFGTWTRSTGEPGRTVLRSDSSEVSIPPITNAEITLHLKRFGRAIETTKGFHGSELDFKIKGKWTLTADTLTLHFGELVQLYRIDQSIEERIFLYSLSSNMVIYGRKE